MHSAAALQGSSSNGANTGVVVDECMVRWVPYKHANGMAIYYRQTPQEEGKGMPQVRSSDNDSHEYRGHAAHRSVCVL